MKTVCYDGSTIETSYHHKAERYATWVFPQTGPGYELDWMSAFAEDEYPEHYDEVVNGRNFSFIEEDDDRVAEMHRDAWRSYNDGALRLEPREINVR